MVECYIRIKEAMHLRNKTQAELCKITGIPKSAMSQYVSGKFVPKQTRIYLLAKALNVNEAWLMGYDVPMERDSQQTEQKTEPAPESSETDPVEEMVKQLTNKLMQLDDARLLQLDDYLSYLEWKMQKEHQKK